MNNILALALGLEVLASVLSSCVNYPNSLFTLRFRLSNIYHGIKIEDKFEILPKYSEEVDFKFERIFRKKRFFIFSKFLVVSEKKINPLNLLPVVKYIDTSLRLDPVFFLNDLRYVDRVASKIYGCKTFLDWKETRKRSQEP